ncbi:MAG: hypothetical protein J3K34DRAFT_408536 [Monoraphidium minutum]|nr:MAG: hypothetical protein J3K34DRAFT_408536 [Monoraphidium minutum]
MPRPPPAPRAATARCLPPPPATACCGRARPQLLGRSLRSAPDQGSGSGLTPAPPPMLAGRQGWAKPVGFVDATHTAARGLCAGLHISHQKTSQRGTQHCCLTDAGGRLSFGAVAAAGRRPPRQTPPSGRAGAFQHLPDSEGQRRPQARRPGGSPCARLQPPSNAFCCSRRGVTTPRPRGIFGRCPPRLLALAAPAYLPTNAPLTPRPAPFALLLMERPF